MLAHDNNQEPASRWLWQSGRDAWTAFAPNQASALEQAWATGGGVVRIDAERQVRVDTSGAPMRQERVDNPGRNRAVKRENGGAQEGKRPRLTPAAPSATADADGGGGGGVSPAASGPPLAWRLNRLGEQWSRVLPATANTDSVSLDELLSAGELEGATQLHLHNYLFDLDFVFETCPALGSFVASGGLVKVFHGDGRPPRSVAATTMPAAVECFEPPTEQFGTMHSKCIVVVRPSRLSVHVITANFIFSVARDWHNKTNGVWSGSFPRLDAPPPRPAAGTFGLDLLEYYEAVRAIGADKPGSWSSSDQDGAPPRWRALDVSWLSLYDYSGARARLVASVPGTSGATAGRHTGEHIQKRVRGLLAAEGFAVPLDDSVLALQFSSLSSVGNNDKWLRELLASLCGGSAVMPRLRVVYPTRAQVGASLEGWVAGASIPCQTANAAKLRSVLTQLSGASALARLCGWDGGPSGRAAAVPHIKSYALYTDEGRLGWAMLTSSNLSQAAWGKLEKGGTQLYIKSYELGVLVLPSLQPGGRQSLVATSAAPLAGEESATLVPLPYTLPPTPYASSDDAWSTDGHTALTGYQPSRDAHDRHGFHPGLKPPPVHMYGPNATGRVLAQREAARRS